MTTDLRTQAKQAVARFRSSWVDAGRLLNEIVYGGDYKEWGFDEFAVYCARELGLNKPTVQKLMISYNYMRKHQAEKVEALEGGDAVALPSHETVALLDKAERDERVSAEDVEELRNQAFSDQYRDDLAAQIKRRLSPRREVDPDKAEMLAVIGAARKLRKAMSVSHFVPDGLKERIEEPLVELEALD